MYGKWVQRTNGYFEVKDNVVKVIVTNVKNNCVTSVYKKAQENFTTLLL